MRAFLKQSTSTQAFVTPDLQESLVAPALAAARTLLMSGPGATPPRRRACAKLARLLLSEPKIAELPRHMRGSWRSWPRA